VVKYENLPNNEGVKVYLDDGRYEYLSCEVGTERISI
jgi:hypothetical protein